MCCEMGEMGGMLGSALIRKRDLVAGRLATVIWAPEAVIEATCGQRIEPKALIWLVISCCFGSGIFSKDWIAAGGVMKSLAWVHESWERTKNGEPW